jgi:hypothetical protein
MPSINPDQFETQVFPFLSTLALRNDLKEQYLLNDYTNLACVDHDVLVACQPVVSQNQSAFLGVFETTVRPQTMFNDGNYDPRDCPKTDTVSKVFGFLKLVARRADSKKAADWPRQVGLSRGS